MTQSGINPATLEFLVHCLNHCATACPGNHLVHYKIEIDGTILEQVKQFNYLGCELSFEVEPDFDKKIKIPKHMRLY
jgi:hypothetical protein